MKKVRKGLLATLIMLMFFGYSAKAGQPVGAPAPTDPNPIESLGKALVEDAKLIWHWIVG